MKIIKNYIANSKISNIIEGGADNLEIVFDFDRTIIHGSILDNHKVVEIPSVIAILREVNFLDEQYVNQTKSWYNHYSNLSKSYPQMTKQELSNNFEKWWRDHYNLLQNKGLTLDIVKNVCLSNYIKIRGGIKEIFDICHDKNIKIIIVTSTGLGLESVIYILQRYNIYSDNIEIISNNIVWNNKGQMIGIIEPVIHSYTKNTFLKVTKKNIIVVGDGLGDAELIKESEGQGAIDLHVLKVGIFENNIKSFNQDNLEKYKKSFDIVLESVYDCDQDLIKQEDQEDFVNDLVNLYTVKDILEKL